MIINDIKYHSFYIFALSSLYSFDPIKQDSNKKILKILLKNLMFLCHIFAKSHLDQSQRNSSKKRLHSQQLLVLKGRATYLDTMGLMKRLCLK